MITRSSRGRPISRRRLLKVSLSAAGAYSLQGARHMARAAGAVKQVTLTLDWVFQGPNVGFMLAQDNGFYRDAGLDVAITAGKGLRQHGATDCQQSLSIRLSDGYVVGSRCRQGNGR